MRSLTTGALAITELEILLRRFERESARLMPSVASTLSAAPNWFTRLNEHPGIAELAGRLNAPIPLELQLFYRFPAFACALHSRETDLFLDEYSDGVRPPVVRWCGIDHLVIAEFPYASCIQAVALVSDNPRVEWGYDGDAQPDVNIGPIYFSDWLTKLASIKLDETNGIRFTPESTHPKSQRSWRSFFFSER